MKTARIILVIAASFLHHTLATAQDNAVGVRLSHKIAEADYQRTLGQKLNFLEFTLGTESQFIYESSFYDDYVSRNFDDYRDIWGVKFSCTYNFAFDIKKWDHPGAWTLYVGTGLAGGYGGSMSSIGCLLSFPIHFGASYSFSFPLKLSLDFRPEYGIIFDTDHQVLDYATSSPRIYNEGTDLYYSGLFLGVIPIPALSLHYLF